jgi:hypothetical protein
MHQEAQAPPIPTQLALPFSPPDAVTRFLPPLAEVVVRPRHLWRRLSPAQQDQLRQTLVRIWQEVLDADAQHHG